MYWHLSKVESYNCNNEHCNSCCINQSDALLRIMSVIPDQDIVVFFFYREYTIYLSFISKIYFLSYFENDETWFILRKSNIHLHIS